MATIFDVLDDIKRRPSSIGPETDPHLQLQNMQTLLLGYVLAIDAHDIDDPGAHLLRRIAHRLRTQRGWSMSCGAIDAMLCNSATPAEAWQLFWSEVALEQRAYEAARREEEDATHPSVPNTWRVLSEHDRMQWLASAWQRRAHQRRPDAPAGSVFPLDAELFDSLLGFFCALGESVNGPGGYFGKNIESMKDCLAGGFGARAPFTLRVLRAPRASSTLDSAYLRAWCKRSVADSDVLHEGREWIEQIQRAAEAGTLTMYDVIADTLRVHGVTVETE